MDLNAEHSTDNRNLKRILDYLKISYWLVDLNFVLLDVNDTFLELTGADRDKLIGRDVSMLISREEKDEIRAILYNHKNPVQFELYLYGGKRKEKIPVLFHLSFNLDRMDRPVSVNVLMVDIRKQKQIQSDLEKEKKMLQTILFGIRDSVAIFDEESVFMFGNKESTRLHADRKTPLIPMDSKGRVRLSLNVDDQTRHLVGEIRPIYDHEGRLFAYAETLTDFTNEIRLEEKERELFHVKRQIRRKTMQTEMIGSSRKMTAVVETILRCAEVDSSVLITGETGVGKEVAARSIYAQSRRKNKPFVSVNCGALPEALLESELFGHVKGAFTGATSNRAGLFREANEGVLFLDEIGELNKNLQVKILKALQDKEVRPVGDDRSYPVDVRIICATNRNLKAMVNAGDFRSDLYYRIAVIPILIPPLRERGDDVLKLVEHFIARHQKGGRRRLKKLDPASRRLLYRYDWPGNIRELENAVEHALAMSTADVITPDCFPLQVQSPELMEYVDSDQPREPVRPDWRHRKQAKERQAVYEALSRHEGNQTAAAKELGISRVTLWRKKTMYNL